MRKNKQLISSKCYAVVNYKGGVGKSTVAENLAAKLKASIIDLDHNGDSARFGAKCGLDVYRAHDATAESLYNLVESLKKKGHNVVIDCPPGLSPLTHLAILCCDVVVCPTRPGPHDVYAIGRISSAVREAAETRGEHVPFLFVCNFYRNTEIAKLHCNTLMANSDGEFVGRLWERKEYAEAIDQGMPVWKSHPKSLGAAEMLTLIRSLVRTPARATHG